MDFPSFSTLPFFVGTYSRWGAAHEVSRFGNFTPSSQTWPVANRAYYFPMWVPWPYPVKRIWWVNGTSVTTTNVDFGIYTIDGTRLYSTGSTVMAGASAAQYVTPSPDLILSPGRYYFALSDDSTTLGRGFFGNAAVSVSRCRRAGILQEDSALPLPATMTPVAVTSSMVSLCGVTRTASGF